MAPTASNERSTPVADATPAHDPHFARWIAELDDVAAERGYIKDTTLMDAAEAAAVWRVYYDNRLSPEQAFTDMEARRAGSASDHDAAEQNSGLSNEALSQAERGRS